MTSDHDRLPGAGARRIALAAMLAALVLLAPAARAADDEPAETPALAAPVPALAQPQGATCGPGAGNTEGAVWDVLEPTRPGPWRRDMQGSPRERVPGTRMLAPQDPKSTDAMTAGRWVPGYRPATPAAQAAFDAWKAGRLATLGIGDLGRVPNASSNYAANLLAGKRSENVPEDTITHTVHAETYAGSPIDLRRIDTGQEGAAPPRTKRGAESSRYDHHSGLTWEEFQWVKKRAESAPPTLDGQDASTESAAAPTPGGVAFDALMGEPAKGAPPDPIMAVGPLHLVAIVNREYQVWDKSGKALISPITMDQFFRGVPNCKDVFDVFVDYDEASNRFVMGGEALYNNGDDSYLCVAASATNDPTGTWNRISFRSDSVEPATWLDYPHMGIGLDAVYIAANMYLDNGGFDSIRFFALDKDALYQGAPVRVAEAGLGATFFTAQPVKIHGYTSGGWPAPGTPHHFISHDAAGNSRIWRWSNPFASPPVIYGTVVEAAFGGAPPSADELGAASDGKNDTGSGHWLDAEYRGGTLWATRNTACNFGEGEAETCVDWIQIDVSGAAPVLQQQQAGGAYGSAGDHRYYPDVAVDRNGSIAIGYTKSSATTYTQVWVTGREVGDPPNTLQGETLQRAGLGNYTDGVGCSGGCDRWGDYTGMTIDPDGCTFWYFGEFSDGGYGKWGTHVSSFKFDSCSTNSSLQLNKGSFNCADSMTVTVTDSIAIDAATVSARTTVTVTSGDSETLPAASWTGSECSGSACKTWRATLPVSGTPGPRNNGTLNVADSATITVRYADPHAGHAQQSVDAAVVCRTSLEDAGYLVAGGCEGGAGSERYREYIDGGEYISYTFGVYNPPTVRPLTDVNVELFVTGPAADKVIIFNPTARIGPVDTDQVVAPVFALYVDPSIDAAGFRMSEHAFNLRITSVADGLTAPQVVTQTQLLQADDNIVNESHCWNFEGGAQGFVEVPIDYWYDCPINVCGAAVRITSAAAPWTRGGGCGSETRSDDATMTCDVAGTSAFKTNPDAASCGTFTQSITGVTGTITDSVLYSPIFGPAHTGNAANGQPWFYEWNRAGWYFRSEMNTASDPTLEVGFWWDPDYKGVSTPTGSDIYTYYPYGYGYFTYRNREWDSSTPWNPDALPRNYDQVVFGGGGEATPGLQWRWAVHVTDLDMGGNPLTTAATAGLTLDDLNLTYTQFHAAGQVGSCSNPAPVVSFDRYTYTQCPNEQLGVTVLDGTASGAVQVTVTSRSTGDSETFSISGAGPYFAANLPASTGGGPRSNDGTLFIAPSDVLTVTYNGGSGPSTVSAAGVQCTGGDVVVEGLAGLSDNGDRDTYADTNEIVNITIKIKNNTGQPLQNVRAIIDSTDPAVGCITKNTASFGTIAAGGTGVNNLASDPFTFKVSGAVACTNPLRPPAATFQVLILADGFDGPLLPQEVTLDLDLNDKPGTVTYVEPFTAEPAGFYHELGPGDDDGVTNNPNGFPCSPYADRFFWRGTGGNPGGGYFCWQNETDNFPDGVLGDLSDSVLYSPAFKVGAAGVTLTFDHEYLFGYSGQYRLDGARVDYRVNGGTWRKLTTLTYDGALIYNVYCNPLCNVGGATGTYCFAEEPQSGERIFNQLDQGVQNWKPASGAVPEVVEGDLLQFRWRVGSMRSSIYGISTKGGYAIDNVTVTNVIERTCDATAHQDVGCGVILDGISNLTEVCGDGDTFVEPTERWSVDVTLRNSSASPAANTLADLTPSAGSRNPASVVGNPGSFGTLAAAGGTGTARFEFIVGPDATCIDELLFDVTDIADSQRTYADEPSALSVPIGGAGAQETSTQTVDPLLVADGRGQSPLAPALTIPAPAFGVELDYTSEYTNIAPTQTAAQVTDPLDAENASRTSLLDTSFTISVSTATAAVVDWTSLTHANVTNCVRVRLRTPKGIFWTLKAYGDPVAKPYNVLSTYRNSTNGGPGQYSIEVQESTAVACTGKATMRGATMTVTDAMSEGSFALNTRVSLWDGTQAWLIKPYGADDTPPYDVTAIYNEKGPGTWSIRVDENNGGGRARLSGARMTATGFQCNAGCGAPTPAPPPVADGKTGSPARFRRGAGPNEVTVTIDNATCSSNRAVVLYGDLGNFRGYEGAVTGCDIGRGPTATFTAPTGNVWFNVLWVNEAGEAGNPGSSSSGPRTWDAEGLCGVTADDPSDAVCN